MPGLQNTANQHKASNPQARLSVSAQPPQGKLSSTPQPPGNVPGHSVELQASQPDADQEDQSKDDNAASLQHVSEAPDGFSNRQLLQMQQRQQQLLQNRLAALQHPHVKAKLYQSTKFAGRGDINLHQTLPSVKPCSSTVEADNSALTLPQGRASPQLAQSQGRASPNSFQAITDREPVADSPITLFSLGSPYSSSSPRCSSAGLPPGTTSSPSEWAKLMAVQSMVGSVLASKADRASSLAQDGSGTFPRGPIKGILSRASSSVPVLSSSDTVSKPGTAAPAVAKSGRRAVFSRDALPSDPAATPGATRKFVGGNFSSSPAAVQSANDDTASAMKPQSSAAEEGVDRQNAAAESQHAPRDKLRTQTSLETSVRATTSNEDGVNILPHSSSYVFKHCVPGGKQQRTAVPAASPLSRVVTYRPEMLRAAASAYQSAGIASGTSQNRVQESMWEDSPVVATLRQSGMTLEQREKQDEFAAQLGQWYKEQLQRRVPNRSAGLRTLASIRMND